MKESCLLTLMAKQAPVSGVDIILEGGKSCILFFPFFQQFTFRMDLALKFSEIPLAEFIGYRLCTQILVTWIAHSQICFPYPYFLIFHRHMHSYSKGINTRQWRPPAMVDIDI